MRKILLFIFCFALSIIQVVQGQTTTWQSMNQGLTDSVVNTISIGQDGFIYAGTEYRGIYKSSNIIDAVEKPTKALPNKFFISQNYPNPFNPSTIIEYQIPKSGLVTVKVYDILGRVIATLVNGEKPAGNYEVKFDGSGLASGIYLYRIQAGDYSSVKKMILSK